MTAGGLDDHINHLFGARLLNLRCAAKLTPRALAELAEVQPGVIGQVEDGKGCTRAEAVKLAKALGVPVVQLLGLTPAGAE